LLAAPLLTLPCIFHDVLSVTPLDRLLVKQMIFCHNMVTEDVPILVVISLFFATTTKVMLIKPIDEEKYQTIYCQL
jgi:hypothetical protein